MKKIKKRMLTLAGAVCLSATVLLSPVTTMTADAAVKTETVSPCADSISYRYKIENGKMYRRLFNYTTNSWIGEWQYVADVS